ncbi:MAG: LTA synthase family protein, partial [Planctomycetes bacterium]|nr:LTA synthase family protein [Planctomycetota bacterium]
KRAHGARRVEVGLGALALTLLVGVIPVQSGPAPWRQTNALARLPSDLLASDPLVSSDDPLVLAAVAAVFSADLSGAPLPRVAGRGRGKNVLVLVVERLSAAYVKQGQQAQGIEYGIHLPALEALADEHLFFPNYFSHQAQSNRGLYSLLAGELPHLRTKTSKMTEVTTGTRQRAAYLPKSLQRAGYRTVFLESTPLYFMGMGQFMRQAGFDLVQDSSHVAKPRAMGGWGVDDGSLLDHTASVIEDLERESRPWFVTVFTAGTHHPYTIPDPAFRAEEEDFARSFYYLDKVLGEFLDGLRTRGVLEDTLVLITCDESAGLPSSYEGRLERLDKNWGFLLAITPEGWKGQDPAVCGQADLALSILDYLGLEEEVGQFGGRSVFRRYETPRDFYLGNTYTRQLAVFSKEGILALFDERLNLASSRAYDPQALLRLGDHQPAPARLRDQLVGVLQRGSVSGGGEVRYAFAGTGRTLKAQGRELLISGQFFEVPPDSVLVFDLDLVLRPEAGRTAGLWTALNDDAGMRTLHETKSGPYYSGGRRQLRYWFATTGARHKVEVRLGIDQEPGRTTQIEVREATLRVIPRAAWEGGALPDDAVKFDLDRVSLAPGK